MTHLQQEFCKERLREEYCRHMRQYWPDFLRFAIKLLPNRNDAEEVLQDASLVIWHKYGEFRRGSNFSAWAKAIISYEVLAYRKKKRKNGPIYFSNDLVEELAAEEIEQKPRVPAIYEALEHCTGKLSEKDRNLLQLRYQESQSVREIARSVKRSAEGVYKAFGRIRLALHGCIQRELARDARHE